MNFYQRITKAHWVTFQLSAKKAAPTSCVRKRWRLSPILQFFHRIWGLWKFCYILMFEKYSRWVFQWNFQMFFVSSLNDGFRLFSFFLDWSNASKAHTYIIILLELFLWCLGTYTIPLYSIIEPLFSNNASINKTHQKRNVVYV